MITLVRYLVSDVLRGQRWAAPLLAFLAMVLIITPPQGPDLPTFAMSAAALLPTALWLTVVVIHSEEPVQASLTLVTVGSPIQVWLAKCVTAYLFSMVFAAAALTWISLSTDGSVSGAALGVGAVAHFMTGYAGVAFGMLLCRPIITRIAWTVLLGTGICLAQLLVAHLPPVNALLMLYNAAPDRPMNDLLLIVGETLVLATAALSVAYALARRRT